MLAAVGRAAGYAGLLGAGLLAALLALHCALRPAAWLVKRAAVGRVKRRSDG